MTDITCDYRDCDSADIGPLIQAINMLGENLVGLELGVDKGESSLTILHNCSIQKLYLIDSWKPYDDWLKTKPDGKPAYSVNRMDIELCEFLTRLKVKYSGMSDNVEIIKKDSLDAVKSISDLSLDFIFFDAMMTKEQSYNEAHAYYPKIKKGGIFMGHDANAIEQVMKPIASIKQYYNNKNKIHRYLNTFLFKI
jgi:hypothetical protein|tara:strand:+ start:5595 stop:6179 length:585 start_codon:yes stop_codon:yes gene_type:complete